MYWVLFLLKIVSHYFIGEIVNLYKLFMCVVMAWFIEFRCEAFLLKSKVENINKSIHK